MREIKARAYTPKKVPNSAYRNIIAWDATKKWTDNKMWHRYLAKISINGGSVDNYDD